MPFNLPIFLTWLRIVMIPLVVGVFYCPDTWLSVTERHLVATVIFQLAALTDWLVMASGVLGELSHGAPVSVMAQSVSLATTMRLRSGGG